MTTRSPRFHRAVANDRAADRMPVSWTVARREWESASSGLCRAHAEQLRALPVADVDEFLAHRQTRPLPPCAPCAVAACTRQRRHPDGLYCEAHQQRLRTVRTRDPHLDETRWQATEPAIGRGGEVSLRGLPPLVVAELLVGLQQRCRINAVKTNDAVLRALCNDVRRRQVGSLTDYAPATTATWSSPGWPTA